MFPDANEHVKVTCHAMTTNFLVFGTDVSYAVIYIGLVFFYLSDQSTCPLVSSCTVVFLLTANELLTVLSLLSTYMLYIL